MIVVALVLAAAVAPVRVQPRPDVPWVVAIAAAGVDLPGDPTTAKALVELGGTVTAANDVVAGAVVVVAEGPPDAEAAVVEAARAALGAHSGAVFVDGRTKRVDAGRLPPMRAVAGTKNGAA